MKQWQRTELSVGSLLRYHGVKTFRSGARPHHQTGYDWRTASGLRLEVKSAKHRKLTNGCFGWRFTIARAGELNEADVDYYILHCQPDHQGLFGKRGFYLVAKAPLNVTSLTISLKSLLKGKHKFECDFSSIIEAERNRTECPLPSQKA